MTLLPYHARVADTVATLVSVDLDLDDDRDAWHAARSRAELSTLNALPDPQVAL